MNTDNSKRQVVVITGASAGVGRATACEFARQGAAVALLARGAQGLEGTRREVERLGGMALVIPTDVAHAEQVEAAAEKVEAELGPIDVWVNNAMTTIFAAIADIQPDDFRRATEVTYLGVVYGTMAALRRMKPRNRGSIVQVGSALAYRAIPLQAPYCGAKHAIRGFTDSLRAELIHDQSSIRVSMVQLPAMNTPQFGWCKSKMKEHPQPVPPIFQPEVGARAIVWASAHGRREVHVGFSSVKVIWANKFAPGLADWLAAKQGVSGQKADFTGDPERPFNLYEPVDQDEDHGAHGRFDDEARRRSWQYEWTIRRGPLAAAAALSLIVLGGLIWATQSTSSPSPDATAIGDVD